MCRPVHSLTRLHRWGGLFPTSSLSPHLPSAHLQLKPEHLLQPQAGLVPSPPGDLHHLASSSSTCSTSSLCWSLHLLLPMKAAPFHPPAQSDHPQLLSSCTSNHLLHSPRAQKETSLSSIARSSSSGVQAQVPFPPTSREALPVQPPSPLPPRPLPCEPTAILCPPHHLPPCGLLPWGYTTPTAPRHWIRVPLSPQSRSRSVRLALK